MKSIATLLSAAALGLSLTSGAAQAGELSVEVQGLTEMKGNLLVAVFNQKGQWLKQATLNKKTEVTQKVMSVQFDNLPEGEYAVSVFHDLNGNGRLDSNPVGMPIEPYGFSNNAPSNFGPPSYDAAKITLDQAKTVISIRVN
ncbi:DUF2141 domain-containing protein [Undibacterium macrobrachii]|jgi:uncharacterized protein (DUF2141 family)|uniref:DUF2141 domain-containing protein n=1 Tax=Undibacterium macrobrachii TaxID=1119058 RepID=A0ABQ2XL95_9BURK|nr:DUF2141 domain-containing protein [Undibacterium macrobrachii]GGX22960.1 hypothetical protein GCM10011282_31290 [Undibacterium macrobrachii]